MTVYFTFVGGGKDLKSITEKVPEDSTDSIEEKPSINTTDGTSTDTKPNLNAQNGRIFHSS